VNELCRKFAHSRFEPSGFTRNPEIPNAKSIIDYIFRWLELTFPGGKCRTMVSPAAQDAEGVTTVVMSPVLELEASKSKPDRTENQFNHFMEDAPACDVCGTITVRNGACYRCHNCGNSMGCS
jgi:ribonucleoside-diphosphate reductase alpha chain